MPRRGTLQLRRIIALLRPHAVGEGRKLALGGWLGVAVVGLHIIRPWPLKWLLDLLTSRHRHAPIVAWAANDGVTGAIALSAAFVALSALFALAEYAQRTVLNGVANRMAYRLRTALFEQILQKPLDFHESHESGELLTRIVYDTTRLRRGVAGILLHVFQTLFLLAATSVVLFWIAPLLAILVAAGGGAALMLIQHRGRRIAAGAHRQRRKEGRIAALVAAELDGVREMQALGTRGSAAATRFRRKSAHSLGSEQQVSRLSARMGLQVELLFASTVAIVMAAGAYAVARERFSAGDLVLFVTYVLALREPFAQFARQASRLGRTAACADRLAALARVAHPVAEATAAPPLRGAIRLDGISVKAPKKTRGARKWALDGVSCAIAPGERIAVIGRNGAGKSTLLRVVLGILPPTHGDVTVDGHEMARLEPGSLREQLSVVFQDTPLFGATVGENIGLGRADASAAEIARAAEEAHVSRLIDQLPAGYDTPVRRRGALFSAGERQRIAIARALLRNGRVWLLDEPTAGLDGELAAQLVDTLLERTRGRTTLWATHDRSLIPRLDRVLVLAKGQVAFLGDPREYERWSGRPLSNSGTMAVPQLQES